MFKVWYTFKSDILTLPITSQPINQRHEMMEREKERVWIKVRNLLPPVITRVGGVLTRPCWSSQSPGWELVILFNQMPKNSDLERMRRWERKTGKGKKERQTVNICVRAHKAVNCELWGQYTERWVNLLHIHAINKTKFLHINAHTHTHGRTNHV